MCVPYRGILCTYSPIHSSIILSSSMSHGLAMAEDVRMRKTFYSLNRKRPNDNHIFFRCDFSYKWIYSSF